MVFQPRLTEPGADIFNEFRLELNAGLPDFLVGHLIDFCPDVSITLVSIETLIEILMIKVFPLFGTPRGEVHAIGNLARLH